MPQATSQPNQRCSAAFSRMRCSASRLHVRLSASMRSAGGMASGLSPPRATTAYCANRWNAVPRSVARSSSNACDTSKSQKSSSNEGDEEFLIPPSAAGAMNRAPTGVMLSFSGGAGVMNRAPTDSSESSDARPASTDTAYASASLSSTSPSCAASEIDE